MKWTISLIRNDLPLGQALNGLAHTILGMGHRIPTESAPSMGVYFADKDLVNNFMVEVRKIAKNNPDGIYYSDFLHEICGSESTEVLMRRVLSTQTQNLNTCAGTICGELHELAPLFEILKSAQQAKGYAPLLSNTANFDLNREFKIPAHKPGSAPGKKAALILARKSAEDPSLMNYIVSTTLSVAQKSDLNDLHLLKYTDADSQQHPHISFHSFPVLVSKRPGRFTTLEEVAQGKNVASSFKATVTETKIKGKMVGVRENVTGCIFGDTNLVTDLTSGDFSLWTVAQHEAGYEPANLQPFFNFLSTQTELVTNSFAASGSSSSSIVNTVNNNIDNDKKKVLEK